MVILILFHSGDSRFLQALLQGLQTSSTPIEHSKHLFFSNFIANYLVITAYFFFEKKPAIDVNFINDKKLAIF
jgi:hypothetical protein